MKSGLKRTSLYASGSSAGKMLEARFYNQDCIVYDLEDSVSAAERMPPASWFTIRCATTVPLTNMC